MEVNNLLSEEKYIQQGWYHGEVLRAFIRSDRVSVWLNLVRQTPNTGQDKYGGLCFSIQEFPGHKAIKQQDLSMHMLSNKSANIFPQEAAIQIPSFNWQVAQIVNKNDSDDQHYWPKNCCQLLLRIPLNPLCLCSCFSMNIIHQSHRHTHPASQHTLYISFLNEHYSLVAPAYTSILTTHIIHIIQHPYELVHPHHSTHEFRCFYIYSLLDNNMLSFPSPPPLPPPLFHFDYSTSFHHVCPPTLFPSGVRDYMLVYTIIKPLLLLYLTYSQYSLRCTQLVIVQCILDIVLTINKSFSKFKTFSNVNVYFCPQFIIIYSLD